MDHFATRRSSKDHDLFMVIQATSSSDNDSGRLQGQQVAPKYSLTSFHDPHLAAVLLQVIASAARSACQDEVPTGGERSNRGDCRSGRLQQGRNADWRTSALRGRSSVGPLSIRHGRPTMEGSGWDRASLVENVCACPAYARVVVPGSVPTPRLPCHAPPHHLVLRRQPYKVLTSHRRVRRCGPTPGGTLRNVARRRLLCTPSSLVARKAPPLYPP